MKKLDNKGFTLTELIATIVVLALITTIAGVSITAIMQSTDKNNYKLLIENINNAVEDYYIECVSYAGDSDYDSITCPLEDASGYYNITLQDLVTYGFLTGNSEIGDGQPTLVNPNEDNASIAGCKIKYKYSDGKITIVAVDTAGACPDSY